MAPLRLLAVIAVALLLRGSEADRRDTKHTKKGSGGHSEGKAEHSIRSPTVHASAADSEHLHDAEHTKHHTETAHLQQHQQSMGQLGAETVHLNNLDKERGDAPPTNPPVEQEESHLPTIGSSTYDEDDDDEGQFVIVNHNDHKEKNATNAAEEEPLEDSTEGDFEELPGAGVKHSGGHHRNHDDYDDDDDSSMESSSILAASMLPLQKRKEDDEDNQDLHPEEGHGRKHPEAAPHTISPLHTEFHEVGGATGGSSPWQEHSPNHYFHKAEEHAVEQLAAAEQVKHYAETAARYMSDTADHLSKYHADITTLNRELPKLEIIPETINTHVFNRLLDEEEARVHPVRVSTYAEFYPELEKFQRQVKETQEASEKAEKRHHREHHFEPSESDE